MATASSAVAASRSKIATTEPPSGASSIVPLPRTPITQPAGTTNELPAVVFHGASEDGRSTFAGAVATLDSLLANAVALDASPATIEKAVAEATAPSVFIMVKLPDCKIRPALAFYQAETVPNNNYFKAQF